MSCGLTIVQTQYICHMSMPTMHKRHRHVRHIVVSMRAFAQRKNLESGSCKMRPQLMSDHLVMQPHGVKLLTKRSMWEDHQPDIRLCSTMLLHYHKARIYGHLWRLVTQGAIPGRPSLRGSLSSTPSPFSRGSL